MAKKTGNKVKPTIGGGAILRELNKNKVLYAMLIPAALWICLFKLYPLSGTVIAFKDFDLVKGIWGSPWAGLKWFRHFFSSSEFISVFWNTLVFSFLQLVFSFPAPIILACLLNEVKNIYFKRTVQTVIYIPHFLSWTIVYGMAYTIFSYYGLINSLIMSSGNEPVMFLTKASYFRPLVIGAGMWKEMGFGTILFLAAMAGINPELYEAATIDGAGRWKCFLHITVPGISSTVLTLLILRMGSILDVGFEQVYAFLNALNMSVGEVLDTFVFRTGIMRTQYSFSTAVGLFKSVIGLVMLLSVNKISRSFSGESVI